MSILAREFNLDGFVRVRTEEKAEDIAEELIKLGTPFDVIVKATKIPIEKIEKMAKKYNENK